MKKFLEKLYDDFPELRIDKEKLDKVVYFLNENKPIIEVSKEFKINLKNRIDSYVWLKQKKKNNFLFFALPVFSFCFVFLWVFYYLWLDEIDNKNLVSNTTYNHESLVYDAPQMSRMMVSDFEEDETIDEDVNLLFEGENSLDSKIIVSVNKNSPEKNIIYDLNDYDSSLVILEQDNYNESNFKIENSEKEEDFSKKDEQEIALSDWYNDYSWGDSMMLMSIFMDANFDYDLAFIDYCEQNLWEFIEYENENNEKSNKCIIEERVCLEENYNNWYCEFEEK